MKLILDKGQISLERETVGRNPKHSHVLDGFILWAHTQGLRGIDHHFGFPVDPAARRLLLTARIQTKCARSWAQRIGQGRISINGRIVCELDSEKISSSY